MNTTRISDRIRGNALGLVAIFLALSGGTAWATHPGGENTISTDDIQNQAVTTPKIASRAVETGKIQNQAVTNAKIALESITNNRIAPGAVNTGRLADGAVVTDKLADAAVTAAKLADGPYWALGGNADTTPATDFLGTTDDTPLDLRVNDVRGLRLEPASDGTNQSPNVIGGIADNAVTAGVHSATIAGGGRGNPFDAATANRVTDSRGTVGGGFDNQAGDGDAVPTDAQSATVAGGNVNEASASQATVAGGNVNEATATQATVAGGNANEASATQSTVGGGSSNTASGLKATVGGGISNTASGTDAAVPGGVLNTASGDRSLAAGRRAKANHHGAFVWADNQAADIASSEEDQFIARAGGGFFLQDDSSLDDQGGFLNTSTGAFLSDAGVWTDVSDENEKEGFAAVAPREVLAKVAELPVSSWSYKAEPGVRHLGPVAQDFHRAFGLGADDRHIASLDANGVALAAIKGLNAKLRRKLRRKQAVIASHERRLDRLERMLAPKRP